MSTTAQKSKDIRLGFQAERKGQLIVAFTLPSGELYDFLCSRGYLQKAEDFIRDAAQQIVTEYKQEMEIAKKRVPPGHPKD